MNNNKFYWQYTYPVVNNLIITIVTPAVYLTSLHSPHTPVSLGQECNM